MGEETLYQFAVLKHPTKKGREGGQRTVVIVPPSAFFPARNDQEVMMLAMKQIPKKEMEFADRLEVAIRPF